MANNSDDIIFDKTRYMELLKKDETLKNQELKVNLQVKL